MVLGKLNQQVQKMTDCNCSERNELQRVLNILRNWVLDRNGEQFTMNDIYSDPALSSKLDVSIGTMILIDRALLILRCVIASKDKSIPFQNLAYKPPNIRRVHRDLICT